MIPEDFIPDIQSIRNGYLSGDFTATELMSHLLEKSKQYQDRNIWIKAFSLEQIQPYLDALQRSDIEDLPLYGIPFAVKDNIDVAAVETTAGCPEFAYLPENHAFIVQQLVNAGAIPLGKTNLDQFATGLVGTRSSKPCRNAINPEYISGGSSSGSAVSVSLGLVSFSLGTDTAGSGRVPAMLNNIYGLKPSRGLFSMSGVVPACRTLDCPSVFALSAEDAQNVFSVAAQYDIKDGYSRVNPYSNHARHFGAPLKAPVLAVPPLDQLQFFGDSNAAELFERSVERWISMGASIVEMDFTPLFAAAKLLYQGPWVAERYAAIEDLMQNNPDAVHPVVRSIVEQAESKNAVDAFKAEYQMQEYRALAERMMTEVDFLLTPTAPRAYKLDDVLENPVELNSNMGFYTNYMNLLDLSGLALPAGFTPNGMPFGITLVGKKFEEQKLLSYAADWQRDIDLPAGASKTRIDHRVERTTVAFSDSVDLAVCGAHLTDMPLNWQLVDRGAQLIAATTTSKNYRLYALAGGPPLRPGLVRDDWGEKIDLEVWSVPVTELGSFVANIPHPLGIGKLELADGHWLSGFICEPAAITDAVEITEYGSWKAYIGSLAEV